MTNEDDESQDFLMEVYERLDELGADTAEAKASNILKGLGFDTAMQNKQCKEFSGNPSSNITSKRSAFIDILK